MKLTGGQQMFVNVSKLDGSIKCQAVAWGHADPFSDPGFNIFTQPQFIRERMTEAGRQALFPDGYSDEIIAATAARWVKQTGIKCRAFFDGTTVDLAVMAARKCLAKAGVDFSQIGLVIVGTNTGTGYPSVADHVKLALGDENSEAGCWDTNEACSVGGAAIFSGWSVIRTGACKYVLVICAEKATTLADFDDWKGANLFGDGAFAVLLKAGDIESFLFFSGHSLPHNGQKDLIVKTEAGFWQDGEKVHKLVGRIVPQLLVDDIKRARIKQSDIDHVVPHQPSGKTVDLFSGSLRKGLPRFRGQIHENVRHVGNISGASAGSTVSGLATAKIIKPGQLVIVTKFGSGFAIWNYGFCMCA